MLAPLLVLLALALYMARDNDSGTVAALGTGGVAQPTPDEPSSRPAAVSAAPGDRFASDKDRGVDRGEEQVEESEPRAATASPRTTSPIVWVRPGKKVELLDAPGGRHVAELGDQTEFGSPTVLSVQRSRPGWVGVSTALLPPGRLGWIRADPNLLRGGEVDYSIEVDLSSRMASLRRGSRLLRRWPVTVGAPGAETPRGRFAVTDVFRGGLNPVYGCCAVAISATQSKLPSGWPGGNLIAFHGTTGPIGIAASHGCIRSADKDVSTLVDTVQLGVPVRIHG